jgi:hypothetical protein
MKKLLSIVIVSLFALFAFASYAKAGAPPQDPAETAFFEEMKSELAAGQCTGTWVARFVHDVINDIDSGLGGYWAFDNYNRQIKVQETTYWNPVGDYTLAFTCTSGCSGVYVHSMNVATFNDETGALSGIGHYNPDASYTWDLTGSLAGSNVAMHILYTGSNPGYYVDLAGVVAPDGTMSGAATSSSGQTFTWATTEGAAKTEKSYCAIARYNGTFDAVKGKTSPGTGYILDGDEDGLFKGGYRAKIKGQIKPGFPTTFQNLGVKDYACNIDTLACSYWSWTDAYFEPGYSFEYKWWGWIYEAFDHGFWVNASTGNVGDIN